jgi:ABC-type lipoprotein release transport system permease subunit
MKRFPLFYIAWLYVFSTKDKIVFFMGQFASLATALTIAIIICTFSIMNGVNDQIRQSIGSYADIVILPSLPARSSSDNESDDARSLEIAQIYNKGFQQFSIEDREIKQLDFIRQQQTLVNYQGKAYFLTIEENPKQTVKATADEATLKMFPALKQPLINPLEKQQEDNNTNLISIFDSQSYNPVFGLMTRALHYGQLPVSDLKSPTPTIYLSSNEYQKLFHNENYNTIRIYLKNDELAPLVAQDIKNKFLNSNFTIHQWKELKPELLDALDLQKKIFNLVYAVLFTLLCAIIISTNVAFFKDKRKDWALYKILNVFSYSVERIFFYKSLISFLLSAVAGGIIGVFISIYSNEIINFFMLLGNHGSTRLSQYVFGLPKITYAFHYSDFIYVLSFSLAIYLLNFITLVLIFRHEKVSDFLNAS